MPEHQYIEWKESWRDEYLKWVCAFANSQGGVLIIGKRDDGSIKGIDNSKKLLETLPNKISNALGLICDVNLKNEGELEYIEVIVEPSSSAVAYDGRYFKRTGSTTKLLTGQALADFLRLKSNIPWDEVVIEGASLEDIDEAAIDKFKEEAKKSGRVPSISESTSVLDVLRNLDLTTEDGLLKRAGVILFAKRPSKFVREAILKIGRFGESPSDLRSQELIEGNNFQLADKVIQLLDYKYIIRNISYDGLTRVETPEYPFEAIREAIFNAIIHREYDSASINVSVYDDRLEIWNDGLLNEKLSIEDLKKQHRSYPRNKLMANVFYKAGYIESWGRGTVKIMEEAEKNGLPEPEISEYSGGVAVTLFKKPEEGKASSGFSEMDKHLYLNSNQRWVVDFLEKHETLTSKDYQEKFDIAERTARYHLSKMVELELIDKVGEKSSTRYILKK
jgi:ATP-dependent DNA helicase RecG